MPLQTSCRRPKPHREPPVRTAGERTGRGTGGLYGRYRPSVLPVQSLCTGGTGPLYWWYKPVVLPSGCARADCPPVPCTVSPCLASRAALSVHSRRMAKLTVAYCSIVSLTGNPPCAVLVPKEGILFSQCGNICFPVWELFSPKDRESGSPPCRETIETSSEDLYLLGGHRYWCSETSGRSRKYGHKKCPESLLGRLSPPPEQTALNCFAMAKVSKNPETSKRFRDFLH